MAAHHPRRPLRPSSPSSSSSSSSASARPSSAAKQLAQIQSIPELAQEALAHHLSPRAISYYASGTDDELTKRDNSCIYRDILLRPRVLPPPGRSCAGNCSSLRTSVLGIPVGLPIFVAPAAQARLAHPDGEAAIARACARFGALQIISTNASLTPEVIVNAVPSSRGAAAAAAAAAAEVGGGGGGDAGAAVFAWQLYVLRDRAATERMLARVAALPQVRFIVLTLDAPWPGKREADERFKARAHAAATRRAVAEGMPAPPAPAWGTDAGLTWRETLAWLRAHTRLPVVLKGVQTYEDAWMAAAMFPDVVRGIVLSNHGGRALDTAPPAIQTLLEIRRFCPEVLDQVDVLVDGGIERGEDVVKALALGAKAVGIGRAALYGLAVGGQAGVERVLSILSEETLTCMQRLGVKNPSELNSRHINTRALNSRLLEAPIGLESICSRADSKL